MMKKKIAFILLLCVVAAGVLGVGVTAAEVLTGGMEAVAGDSTMIKGAIAGDAVRFSATDFKQAMGIRRFDAITVTALPDAKDGMLYFGEQPIPVGTVVPRASLDNLTFIPKDDEVSEARFTFTCDAYAGGAEVGCTIRFAEKMNGAPTILESTAVRPVSTYAGLTVEGVLCAADPEGDALEFIIVDYPEAGTLTLTDAAYGTYCYTPRKERGEDRFTVVVRDCYGNYSSPVTVEVEVKARPERELYCDLPASGGMLPALVLAEEEIMPGTLVGDGMYFSPTATVSRGDFLVMAMKAAGVAPRAGLLHTVFDDDADIRDGIRPYVATAQERGYAVGCFGDEGLIFDADAPITRGEAAVMLSRILDLSLPTAMPIFADSDALPSSCRAATLSLCAAGIYPTDEGGMLSVEKTLDRAAAAEMLYATLLICK